MASESPQTDPIAAPRTDGDETVNSPAGVSHPTVAVNAARSLQVRRLVQIAVLFHCTIFFEGCESHSFLISLGPIGPVATFVFDDNLPKTTVHDFSLGFLLLNVAAIVGVAVWLARSRRNVIDRIATRRIVVATAFVTALHNSILVWFSLWYFCIYFPVVMSVSSIVELFGALGIQPSSSVEHGLLIICSRLFYVLSILLVAGVSFSLQRLVQKYLLIDPDKWWQVSLGGLLTATVVFGSGLGMLLRLLGV